MELQIGIDSVTEVTAKERVEKLVKKYPEYQFRYGQHETRFAFFVTNANTKMGQPLLDQMKRTAQGGD